MSASTAATPIGIHDLEITTTHHVVDLTDLAHSNGTEPAKYRLGLGQDQFSFPAPDEDIVTMGAAAALPLIERNGSEGIRTVMFATESGVDQSKAAAGQSVPPFRLSLSTTGIGNALEGMGAAGEAEVPPEILDALVQGGPSDHVLLSSEAVPNGMRTRLELQAGVLKVIGAAVSAAMSQFGAGGFPAPGGMPGPAGAFPGNL